MTSAMQQWPLQTMAAHAPHVLGMMLDAPLIGVLVRWPDRLHAVTMEAVVDSARDSRLFESACGKRGLRLLGHSVNGQRLAAPWPPRLKGMPERMQRCRDCWETTGRMRPRTEWRPDTQEDRG